MDRLVHYPSPVMAVVQGDAWGGAHAISEGGHWRGEWSEEIQSKWLQCFYEIALSKPMVDTVTWRDLSDDGRHFLPHGGSLGRDLAPKPAYKQLRKIRNSIMGNGG